MLNITSQRGSNFALGKAGGALIAGGAAGTASSLIRVPTEVVKQRLQTGEYKSAVNAVSATLQCNVPMLHRPNVPLLEALSSFDRNLTACFGSAYPSSSSCLQLRTIISQEGIRRGMYAGYGALMLRDLPFDAIEFVCYEQVRVCLANSPEFCLHLFSAP
eukprot:scaffold74696_cov15-Tisochrysis_lutea.AAC.1